jgi:hypothetical protein
MKKTKDFAQGDPFAELLSEPDTEDTSLFSKTYQEQQQVIDKPVDYVSRKAIELRPLDFIGFYPRVSKSLRRGTQTSQNTRCQSNLRKLSQKRSYLRF